jgi:hypothetical protein
MQNKTSKQDLKNYESFIAKNGLKSVREAKRKIVLYEKFKLQSYTIPKSDYEIKLYLIQRSISYLFNTKMIKNICNKTCEEKKISPAIPPEWCIFFDNEKLMVNKFISRIKWWNICVVTSIKSLFKGMFDVLKFESFELNDKISGLKTNGTKVVLLNPNFPSTNIFTSRSEYSFGYWYADSIMRSSKISFIHFNKDIGDSVVKIKEKTLDCIYVEQFRYGLRYKKKWKLVVFALLLYIRGIVKLFLGDGSIMMAFNDILIGKRISLINSELLPDKIIFSESDGILKPFWINELNSSKTIVEYIFFSSYDSPKVYPDEDPRQDFWQLNNWPNLLCVDDFQAEFISKNLYGIGQVVSTTGFADLTDCDYEFPESFQKKLAVFDYEPGLNHLGYSSISDCGYFKYEVNQVFLKTIYDLARDENYLILYKPKRESVLGNRPKWYKDFLSSLNPLFFQIIPPATSARRLIEHTDVTISMPLTSTGFIAIKNKKLSVYFDPLNRILPSDPALRGVPLAHNKEQLSKLV